MSGLSDGKMCAEAKQQAAAKRSKAAQLKPTDDFSKVRCTHLPTVTKQLRWHRLACCICDLHAYGVRQLY
jgi:hypothetical protein